LRCNPLGPDVTIGAKLALFPPVRPRSGRLAKKIIFKAYIGVRYKTLRSDDLQNNDEETFPARKPPTSGGPGVQGIAQPVITRDLVERIRAYGMEEIVERGTVLF
jgi:hypothetical protein